MYYMDDPHTSQVLSHSKVGLHYHPGMVLGNDIDEGIVVEHHIGSVRTTVFLFMQRLISCMVLLYNNFSK